MSSRTSVVAPVTCTTFDLDDQSERLETCASETVDMGSGKNAPSLARDVFTLGIARIITLSASLVTTAYLARTIGPDGFGALAVAQAALVYLTILSDSGVTIVAIRELSQNPNAIRPILADVSGLRLTLGVLALAGAVAIAHMLPLSPTARRLCVLLAIALPFQSITFDWAFRATRKTLNAAAIQITGAVVVVVLTPLFVRSATQTAHVALVTIFSAILTAFTGWYLLFTSGLPVRFSFRLSAFHTYMRQALPLCLSSIAITLYTQVNIIILAHMLGDREAGLYSAAWRLSAATTTVFSVYYAAYSPVLMHIYARSPDCIEQTFLNSIRRVTMLAAAVALFGFSLREWIIEALFGIGFVDSIPIFSFLLLTSAYTAITDNWIQLVIASRKDALLFRTVAIVAVVNLLLCPLLIRRFGAIGAAYATALAELAARTSLILGSPRIHFAAVFETLKGTILSSAVVFLFLLASADINPLSRLSIAVIVYGVGLWMTKSLHPSEILALVALARCTKPSQNRAETD